MGLVHSGSEDNPSRYRRRARSRSSVQVFLTQLVTIVKAIVIVSLLLLIPALVFYSIPVVRFIFVDAAMHIFTFYYELLTPRNLFLLLNIIIFVILVTANLSKGSSREKKLDSAGLSEPTVDTIVKPINLPHVDAAQMLDNSRGGMMDEGLINPDIEEIDGPVNAGFTSETNYARGTAEVNREGETTGPLSVGEGQQEGEAKEEKNIDAKWTPNKPIVFEEPPLTLSEQRALAAIPRDRRLSHERFAHRKHVPKPPPDQSKNLRISRPAKKGDTLEATWKAISEKKHPPLPRQLRKIETVERETPAQPLIDNSAARADSLHKAETWEIVPAAVPTATTSANGKTQHPKLRRRESSIAQEELNKKIESFIDKFNEQIRLQREQSLIKYKEMVERGM